VHAVTLYASENVEAIVSNVAVGWDRRVKQTILFTNRCGMRRSFFSLAILFVIFPMISKAQSTGRVECPRSDGYVYLYSSMTTLDVRTTLQCGQEVQITGRYEGYFGVRTVKGENGFVPLDSLLLINDRVAPAGGLKATPKPARERTPYDAAAPPEAVTAAPVGPEFVLKNGVTVHLRVSKAVSSTSAHVGDAVALEAAEDVVIDGLLVIAKGAAATGTVSDAEPKKKLGHGGKVGVVVNSVVLSDQEKAAIRGYQEANGANSATGVVIPLKSGKDVEMAQGTEVLAWVDGDMRLRRALFAGTGETASKSGAGAVSAGQASPQ
jgi:hypothetical protein